MGGTTCPKTASSWVSARGREQHSARRWPPASVAARFGAGAIVEEIERQVGHRLRVRAAGKTMLRRIGLFSPLMREIVEMHYLLTDPVVMNDSTVFELLARYARRRIRMASENAWRRSAVTRQARCRPPDPHLTAAAAPAFSASSERVRGKGGSL